MRRHRRAAREAQRETNNAITTLEACRVQLVNAVAERDVARAEIQDVRAERDEVIRLAKAREAARIQTMFQAARQAMEFDHREQELCNRTDQFIRAQVRKQSPE